MLDIVLSGLALIVLSPLLIAVALLLLVTGEREIFFVQQRVGRGGKMFGLLKFATMLKNSPNIGTGVLTVRNDPRVLPVGRLLRKTKINELPQLLNVLLGDMSLIGPRPQAKAHFDVFPDGSKAELLGVRPGLSGPGAIVFRDEEIVLGRVTDQARFYAEVIAPYKAEIELWYIRRQSVGNFLLLLGLTVWTVIVPSSKLYRRALKELPPEPRELSAP